ncbi:alpha/beta fold hydrolase [Pseudonocardia sp. TRM90224]|uniref:alpha/beta fold hydrolase n=1 Tax=Pseudonocardia sp. TRM90224 TaxID=2812678 RepID=UPI001E305DE1|nr:alpha/beta fold hydrolase [Pseudonocardia sp. TRM90224]
MHVERHGTGSPTVLLEAGVGHHSAYWGVVPELLAATTSVVTYDRRGYGRSPARRAAPSVASYLADLEAVLALCDDGPLVLVGHSLGGFLIRAAAAAHPERVGALVFVDSATENEMDGLPERARRLDALGPWLMLINAGVAATGLARLPAVARRVDQEFAGFPPRQRAAIVADQASTRHWRTASAELRAYGGFRDHALAHRADPVFAKVPVTVITATVWPDAMSRQLGMSPAEYRDQHLRSQREAFEALAPEARFVAAERSGHVVQHDEPELVVTEVERLVAELRQPAG